MTFNRYFLHLALKKKYFAFSCVKKNNTEDVEISKTKKKKLHVSNMIHSALRGVSLGYTIMHLMHNLSYSNCVCLHTESDFYPL